MKVYIVVELPYHECSTVHGVYATLQAAEASIDTGDAEWEHEGAYVEGGRCAREGCVAQVDIDGKGYDQVYLILEREVKG